MEVRNTFSTVGQSQTVPARVSDSRVTVCPGQHLFQLTFTHSQYALGDEVESM